MKKTLKILMALGFATILIGCGGNGGTDENKTTPVSQETPEEVVMVNGTAMLKLSFLDVGIDYFKVHICISDTDGLESFDLYRIRSANKNDIDSETWGLQGETKWCKNYTFYGLYADRSYLVRGVLKSMDGKTTRIEKTRKTISTKTKPEPVKPEPSPEPVKPEPSPSIVGTWQTKCSEYDEGSLRWYNLKIVISEETMSFVEKSYDNNQCTGVSIIEDEGSYPKYKLGKPTKSYHGKDVFELDVEHVGDIETFYTMVDITDTYIRFAYIRNGELDDDDRGTTPDKRVNDFIGSGEFDPSLLNYYKQ